MCRGEAARPFPAQGSVGSEQLPAPQACERCAGAGSAPHVCSWCVCASVGTGKSPRGLSCSGQRVPRPACCVHLDRLPVQVAAAVGLGKGCEVRPGLVEMVLLESALVGLRGKGFGPSNAPYTWLPPIFLLP